MLEGVDGAKAIMDDILIGGINEKHHDTILKHFVDRITQSNLKINLAKRQTRPRSVKYVGQTITEHGIEPGTDKVCATDDKPTPQTKEDVRRVLCLPQYLAKFLPKMSQVSKPLRNLEKDITSSGQRVNRASKSSRICAPLHQYLFSMISRRS